MDTTNRMDFIAEFEKSKAKGEREANELLYNWILNHRGDLFKQLNQASLDNKKATPLKFWSFNAGNPDHLNSSGSAGDPAPKPTGDAGSPPGGFVYLLTDKEDVKAALSQYSMHPHKYTGEFVLSIDDEPIHTQKRNTLVHKLQDVQIETRMDAAVDISFKNLISHHSSAASETEIDVRKFIREVALRFTGNYFGIGERDVYPDRLATWSGIAFEEYIWKIHARHFIEDRPDMAARDGAIGNIVKLVTSSFYTAPADSVIGRFRQDPGAFSTLKVDVVEKLRESNAPQAEYEKAINKSVASNIIGSIQGLIDNVTTSGCCALNWLLVQAERDGKLASDGLDGIDLNSLKNSATQQSPESLRQYMFRAHRADTPSPFLPRYAHIDNVVRDQNGQSLLDVNVSCAIGAAMGQMSNRDCENPAVWDIRMGYGSHDCIGKYLGDELVIRVLRKLLQLNNLKKPDLKKQWGWIVEKFSVHADLTNVAEQEPVMSNSYIQPALDTGYKRPASIMAQDPQLSPETLQTLTCKELNALPPGVFKQFNAEQTAALSPAQIAGLGLQQVTTLDQILRAYSSSTVHGTQRAATAKRLSVIYIMGATRATDPRPHPYSLWSHEENTLIVQDYTSWPGLNDRKFTARHLKPMGESQRDQLPKDAPYESYRTYGDITALFKYDDDVVEKSRTTLLFPLFAQWFTDSFLRTDRVDRRRNDSNHQIDMCQIYGLSEDVTRILRANDGTGKLISEFIHNNEFPPRLFDQDGNIKPEFKNLPYVKNGRIFEILSSARGGISRKQFYFAAGLERGNSTFGYSAFNTLFLREHNRICEELKSAHSDWDDERLFQTARMIVILIEMKIVISEYINHIGAPPDRDITKPRKRIYVFDNSFAEKQNWYRTNHIAIEFNLLYRWHSLIPKKIYLEDKEYGSSKYVLNNTPLVNVGLDGVLFETSLQNVQKPGLYSTPMFLLAAEHQAIKMSRDFRLAPYNEYRQCFGLEKMKNISDLECCPKATKELNRLYQGDIDKLDFLVGLYAEQPSEGRLFGELMSRMVAYDAFTQVLTNPLLSERIHNAETITNLGMETLEETNSLHDLWVRNQDTNKLYKRKGNRVTMDYPQSA